MKIDCFALEDHQWKLIEGVHCYHNLFQECCSVFFILYCWRLSFWNFSLSKLHQNLFYCVVLETCIPPSQKAFFFQNPPHNPLKIPIKLHTFHFIYQSCRLPPTPPHLYEIPLPSLGEYGIFLELHIWRFFDYWNIILNIATPINFL